MFVSKTNTFLCFCLYVVRALCDLALPFWLFCQFGSCLVLLPFEMILCRVHVVDACLQMKAKCLTWHMPAKPRFRSLIILPYRMDRLFFLNYLPKRWNGLSIELSFIVVQYPLHCISRKRIGKHLWQWSRKWVSRSACPLLCIFRPTALCIRSTLCETSQFRMFIRATFSCPTWTCGRLFPSTMFSRVSLPIFSTMTCSPASSPPLRSKSLLVLRFPTAFQSIIFQKSRRF